MPRTVVKPNSLDFQPRPTYPYSPGAKGGGMVFTAGQVAWDETGNVTGIGDVRAQTVQTLKNVIAVLEEAGDAAVAEPLELVPGARHAVAKLPERRGRGPAATAHGSAAEGLGIERGAPITVSLEQEP